MKLLFLLQSLPYPPSDGIGWKAYNLIRHLASKGWRCEILCFGDSQAGLKAAEFEKLSPNIKVLEVIPAPSGLERSFKKAVSLLSGLPPSLGGFKSRRFRDALKVVSGANRYDAVHYDVINMAQYLRFGPKAPSVLSSNDAISLFYSRLGGESRNVLRKAYLKLAAGLIKRFERKCYRCFDKVHVVSEVDAGYLREVCPGLSPEVIPIAVDNSFLDPMFEEGSVRDKKEVSIAVTGNLDIPYIADGLFEFLERAFPALLRESPQIELHVLGPKASLADEKYLRGFKGVEYLRWVEDYKAFLAAADIVLVPDKSGTGIKTRVLDAMALGKPVLGAKISFAGIAVEDGRHCFFCKNPDETSLALKKLLFSPELRRAVGQAARELIRSGYSQSVVGPKWETLYSTICAAAESRTLNQERPACQIPSSFP